MAACDQYEHHHHHVPAGVPDSNTQNRDGAAIQAKLDELIRVSAAQNRYMGIEGLTEEELVELRAGKNTVKANVLEAALDSADRAEDAANDAAETAASKAKPRFS